MKHATGKRRAVPRGFTLIEVLIALGIFLGSMMAILGLYFHNLHLARMAREEIILSMIQRDIMARNAVVASARAGHERLFTRDPSSVSTPPSFDLYGSPADGTPYGIGAGETTDPAQAFVVGWGIRNVVTWEKVSGLHWGRWTEDQALAAGYANVDQAQSDAPEVPYYDNFYYTVRPVLRDVPDANPTADYWDPGGPSSTPGLSLQDSQFTDWDGYNLADMDRNGYPETDLGLPYPSPGPLLTSDLSSTTTYDNSPMRIFYNSNKMRRYFLRLKVRVIWRVRNEEDVFMSDSALDAEEAAGRRVFNHTTYYFSVFNPDIVRRWQP